VSLGQRLQHCVVGLGPRGTGHDEVQRCPDGLLLPAVIGVAKPVGDCRRRRDEPIVEDLSKNRSSAMQRSKLSPKISISPGVISRTPRLTDAIILPWTTCVRGGPPARTWWRKQ
jgi:hypothetical protein